MSKLITSAGISIYYKDYLLLTHPTNSPWKQRLMPPKGKVEEGESLAQAASREVREEIGIYIPADLLSIRTPREIKYINDKGKHFKSVWLYVHHIVSLSEIGLEGLTVPKNCLQLVEVDWAGFVPLNQLKDKLSVRFLKHYGIN